MQSAKSSLRRSSRETKKSGKKAASVAKVTSLIIPYAQGRAEKPLFNVGEYLRDRWFIRGMIGQGGYGEIYLALDTKEALDVAIKTETRIRRGRTSKRMILELNALLQLQGKPHVPMILASGHNEEINFIVMELLSINVGDLKKMSPARRLSRSSVGRITVQGIAALRDMHLAGFLHRDVKPANMCFGITPATRHVLFLVDLGLVRKYLNKNGTVRKPRRKPGFRGTLRYVSCRVHDRVEQAPIDDLVALVYSAVELLVGDLPWKYLDSYEDVRAAKDQLLQQIGEDRSHIASTPKAFQKFCQVVLSTGMYFDYTHLQSLLSELIGDRPLSSAFDWENSWKELDISTNSTDTTPDDRK